MNEFERGYVSGFFDGEGYLMATERPNDLEHSILLRGEITNTNKESIEYIQSILKCGSIIKRTDKRPNRKPTYNLRFGRNDMRKFLSKLTLIIKHERQQLILEALDLLDNKFGRGNPMPTNIRKRIINIKKEVKEFNRKGT